MAKFIEESERKIPGSEHQSCAEVLAAMDCLMHHMNDEDEIAYWLQDGVPDNDSWHPFEDEAKEGPCGPRHGPEERRQFYEDFVSGMTYGDFEACMKIFAQAVRRQCFATKYSPRAFT